MNPFWRATLFVTTLVVVLGGTILAIFYARGYRVDLSNKSIGATGLLVATSVPDGAQVWVDGNLKSATNSTLALPPGQYTVELKKDGFSTWKKKLALKAEEVVKTDAVLFPVLPNLRPITFSGVVNPTLAPLGDRLVYATPLTSQSTASGKQSSQGGSSGFEEQAAGPGATPAGIPGSPSLTGVAGQSGVQNQALASQLPTRSGLWVFDLIDMPLGFSREPRQIARSTTFLDWSKALTFWSPDERQVLAVFLSKSTGGTSSSLSSSGLGKETVKTIKLSELRAAYLLDSSRLNTAAEIVDISPDLPTLAAQWERERKQTALSEMSKVPAVVRNILGSTTSDFKFSPDETKVLYLATASATLPNNVLPYLPGSNSQPQQRILHSGGVYVYDLKEDRNFWIKDLPLPSPAPKGTIELDGSESFDMPATISWFPTSRHLMWLNDNKITIMEYDGTNAVDVYAGPFSNKSVFPSSNGSKLIVLTDLGSATETANLYSLILR